MEGAGRFVGEMVFFAVVLPMGVTAVVSLVGRRLGRDLGGVALTLGVLAAGIGILGPPVPPQDAHHWVLIGVLTTGVLGVLGTRLTLPWVGLAAALLLSFFAWRTLAPLATMWSKGAMAPLSQTAWVVDALVFALVTWLAVDHAERHAPAPAVLAPLVLALTAGAGICAMGETARIGQMMGAVAAACGALALVSWRYPEEVTIGRAGVGAVVLSLTLFLLYAHFYAEVKRPGAGVALAIPITALAAIGATTTLKGVLRVLAVAIIPTVGAGYLAMQAEVAKTAATVSPDKEKAKPQWQKDAEDMYDGMY
jgi:hypothetical protein